MTAKPVPRELVLVHACPRCGQKPQRACISTAGRKKGEPMWFDGKQRFHRERVALARGPK